MQYYSAIKRDKIIPFTVTWMDLEIIILGKVSPPALNLSQHQDLFQCVSSSHQVAKGLELWLQHQSFK